MVLMWLAYHRGISDGGYQPMFVMVSCSIVPDKKLLWFISFISIFVEESETFENPCTGYQYFKDSSRLYLDTSCFDLVVAYSSKKYNNHEIHKMLKLCVIFLEIICLNVHSSRIIIKFERHEAIHKISFCVCSFTKFLANLYYKPLLWFVIKTIHTCMYIHACKQHVCIQNHIQSLCVLCVAYECVASSLLLVCTVYILRVLLWVHTYFKCMCVRVCIHACMYVYIALCMEVHIKD